MTTEMPNIVIMFADIGGSTRIYETLGDVAARQHLATCIEAITGAVQSAQGTVIKTIGDEVMCTFVRIEDGFAAACAIQDVFEDKSIEHGEETFFDLAVRIGLHFGPAILEDGDVFGDAVNTAARMTELAKPGQILTTKSTRETLPWQIRYGKTRFIDHVPVKGKKDTLDVYEIIWQPDESTVKPRRTNGIDVSPGPTTTLYLNYDGRELLLDEYHCFVILGRGKQCDVMIDDKLASRQHVKIECRKGKFYIIDQSINGTYFCLAEGERPFLRRDEMPLSGSGHISLGRSFDDEQRKPVYFVVDSRPA
jgi:class 3 adenylate cyclase